MADTIKKISPSFSMNDKSFPQVLCSGCSFKLNMGCLNKVPDYKNIKNKPTCKGKCACLICEISRCFSPSKLPFKSVIKKNLLAGQKMIIIKKMSQNVL